MANYCASARTNYFRVTDVGRFVEWLSSVPGVTSVERDGRHALLCECDGGWPTTRWSDDDGESTEFDLAHELSSHLLPTEVAIFLEVGAEKLRYLTGVALAVRADGKTLSLSLNDIYGLVRSEWGLAPTDASY